MVGFVGGGVVETDIARRDGVDGDGVEIGWVVD